MPKEVEYNADISGKSGKVCLALDLSSVEQKCREPLLIELAKFVMPEVGKRIIKKYVERFSEYLKEREGFSDAVYIPYFRSFVTYGLLSALSSAAYKHQEGIFDVLASFAEVVRRLITLSSVVTEVKDLDAFYKRITGSLRINEKIYRLIKPLIPGEVEVTGGTLAYVEQGRVIPWDFVSASVTEAMSLLLSVGENQLVLYEEPESQLYERLQVLMALVLYALSSFNKLVITTHSQTILYTLAYVSYAKPTAEEVKKLLESLGVQGGDYLAKAVEEANTGKVRFYYFHEGKVEEKRDEEIIDGIPDVVEIMRREFDWLSEVYWRRKLGAGNKG